MATQMAYRAVLNVRGSCAPTTDTDQTDPEQPYANSCEGSSLDSELIPLESGETCVAAIMTAQSEGSLDRQKEPILRHREHFVAKSLSNRVAHATCSTEVPARHNLQ